MTSKERKAKRYQKEKARRNQQKQKWFNFLDLDNIFSFSNLFVKGKQCLKGVCWKRSVQLFKISLFSITAFLKQRIDLRVICREKYDKFSIIERRKKRNIAAPRIRDRQIDKALTQDILMPIYTHYMVYDNRASTKGKRFHFSINQLKKDLRQHYKKYKREGWILLIDFKNYFGSGDHDVIYQHHENYFFSQKVKDLLWNTVEPNFEKGEENYIKNKKEHNIRMPLGIEPSQAEMIHYPSKLDNYISCQLHLGLSGHYMDDYRVLIPPNRDPKEILNEIERKAEELRLTINRSKTKCVPLTKKFRFCKIKFSLQENRTIKTLGSKKSFSTAMKKIKMFDREIKKGNKTYKDLMGFAQSSFGYYDNWNDSLRKGRLIREFRKRFGFDYKDTYSYLLEDAKKIYPESTRKIKEYSLSHLSWNKEYICGKSYSGISLFGNALTISKGSKIKSRDGIIIYKNQAICTVTSEVCHNHFYENDDGHGIQRGNLIKKIKEQMYYTISLKSLSREKQWQRVCNSELVQKLRQNKDDDNIWIWKEELFSESIEHLKSILKKVNKK